jgi:hypothetical protein
MPYRGSWQERQIFDRDPAELPIESSREGQEFWLPLVFYMFTWINFFLAIPRTWTPIELQRSPEQQDVSARPAATDIRFKAAGFMALGGLLVICYSLGHSLYHYRHRPAVGSRRRCFYLRAAPTKFKLVLGILALRIGYAIASAFEWTISPFKYNANPGWIYGLGYTPVLLIIIVFNIAGYEELNDDQALMVQREERRRFLDNRLGLGPRKPNWWKKMRARSHPTGPEMDGRLQTSAKEMGVARPQRNDLEMNNMGLHYTDNEDGKDRSPGKEMDLTAAETTSSSTVGISSRSVPTTSTSASAPKN